MSDTDLSTPKPTDIKQIFKRNNDQGVMRSTAEESKGEPVESEKKNCLATKSRFDDKISDYSNQTSPSESTSDSVNVYRIIYQKPKVKCGITKCKTGRKKKIEGVSDNSSLEQTSLNFPQDSMNTIKKKRGRKSKTIELTENAGHSTVRDSKELDGDMRIKTEPTDNITLHLSCDESDVRSELNKSTPNIAEVKRGRGRPRKTPIGRVQEIKTASLEAHNDEVKSGSSSSSSGYKRGVFKRGRGRPRKTSSISSFPIVTDVVSLREQHLSGRNSSANTGKQKRRIKKPKRYEPYQSFDFMDVDGRNTQSSNNTSHDDQDEDSDALQIAEEDDAMAEDVDIEDNVEIPDSGDSNAKHKLKRQRLMKKRKKVFLRPTVECGVCHEKMSERDYEMKHMDKHNFVCWLEGEKPLDPNNETDIVAIYCKVRRIRKKNFSGMKCEKCGIRKKSGVGYFSHVQQCGMSQGEKEAMKVPCPLCGRVMLPCSLKVHMGQEHRSPSTKVPQTTEDEIIPLTKRKAAKRAETKLEEVLADELKDDSVPTKKVVALKRFYRRTQSKLFPNAYVRWKLELEEMNKMNCFVPGCSFTSSEVKMMRQHFYQCPFAVRVFVCKLCDMKLKIEFEMHKHLLNEHKDCLTGDSDFQVNGNSENEEDVMDDMMDDSEASTAGSLKLCLDRPAFVMQAVRKKGLLFFSDIIEKSYKRYLDISSSDPRFEELLAPIEDILSEQDAQKFLPLAEKSMNFSSETTNWKKLDRFQACKFQGTKLIFVGGPAWALSWCPLPLEETRQFLAVACHPDMNMIHTLSTTHNYNSLIQIWDCGELDNLSALDNDWLPQLKLGLAHSHGAVWSLEWCPSGCYQPFDGRLGLLAAAFSDGKAAVYSVSSRPIDVKGLPILESKPVLELELVGEEPAQCTKVAWSKMPPFDFLACGYSDGLIAVFDLSSQSPLLRSGNRLHPFLMFQAHVKSITGLHFLPKEGNSYILTASADRDIKFWNIKDVSGPVSVSQLYRMITVTDIAWFNHWLCAASIYDDALGYGLINVALNGYRDFMFGQPYPVMSQNSLNWSLSVNDWTNALVTSSDGGELTLLHSKQLFCLDEKSNKRTKKYLTTTDLYKLDGSENIDSNIKLKVPQSYEEASEQYGLVLKTKNYEECPSSRREEIERHFFQIKSINKVTWNPNGRSFLHLAAGYHAGFVQIFRDNDVDHAKIVFENFYKKFNAENSRVM